MRENYTHSISVSSPSAGVTRTFRPMSFFCTFRGLEGVVAGPGTDGLVLITKVVFVGWGLNYGQASKEK